MCRKSAIGRFTHRIIQVKDLKPSSFDGTAHPEFVGLVSDPAVRDGYWEGFDEIADTDCIS